jgi:hypothetical protein
VNWLNTRIKKFTLETIVTKHLYAGIYIKKLLKQLQVCNEEAIPSIVMVIVWFKLSFEQTLILQAKREEINEQNVKIASLVATLKLCEEVI